ncbi:MAG: ParB/RepB/Spo0J family partition protein [Flavobacteriales bacterium]
MAKRNALGRGLSALLDNAEAPAPVAGVSPAESVGNVAGPIALLAIADIEANPFQPRSKFDESALEELAQSIRELGIIQPLTVRKLSAKRYQLISGERRFRASQLAGLDEVPAYVRTADDQAMLEMALVENIQRENLDPIEIAISYQRLIEEIGLTQEGLSEKVGKKRSTVTNYLRLLKLPGEVQVGLIEGKISMGHARALISAGDEDTQVKLFRHILAQDLSVRKTEELVRGETPSKPSKATPALPEDVEDAQMALRIRYGNKASIKFNKGKGKIELPFASEAELRALSKQLKL